MAEVIEEKARRMGFTKESAAILVKQTLKAAATVSVFSGSSFSDLRKAVTSKGGVTEQAISVFKKRRMKNIISRSIDQAYCKTLKLSAKTK